MKCRVTSIPLRTIDLWENCQNSLQSKFCRPDLCLKHEPNVKTLLLDVKMMISTMQLTFPSAAPIPFSLSANPDHLKTERLENNLRRCGKTWLTNLKFSSLKEMHSSSQRLTLVHKSSALKIEETGLENLCSNLLPLEVDKHLHLLHLICLFLVFLLKCCNGFSFKPTKPMCDGHFFASSPFCHWACRALFELRDIVVSSLLPCGFRTSNPQWRISISLESLYQNCSCLQIGPLSLD